MKPNQKDGDKDPVKQKHIQQEKIQAKADFVQENKPKLESTSSHRLFFDNQLLEGLMDNNMG